MFSFSAGNFEFQSSLSDLLDCVRAVVELNNKALAKIAGAGDHIQGD
jgi:hypothetical protein